MKIKPFSVALLGTLFAASSIAADKAAHNHHTNHTISHEHHSSLDAAPVSYQDSLYHVDSRWQSQRQQRLQLHDFLGQPVLISMIYGSCRTACPLLVLDAKNFLQQLPAEIKSTVQVVFVSFDHQNDQPKELAEYAEKVGAMDTNWHFLHGEPADIRTLATLLGIRYRQNDNGNFDHSNVLTLLDQRGRIAWRAEGLRQDPAPGIAALHQLLHH